MGLATDNAVILGAQMGTARARVHPLVRILPSLTDVVFLLPIIMLFAGMHGTHSLLGDGDTGWHLRTGEWILANGRVPDQDMFSFTRPGAPWFAWEWGWDVVFAKFYQYGGMAAVVLASLLLVAVTMTLLFRLVRRKSGNVLVAFAVTVLAMAVSSMHWLARPHLVTLLFAVIFCSILERVRDAQAAGRPARLIAVLPALTLLWVNLHAGFFVGILLTLCYAAGEVALWAFSQGRERRAALARSQPYWLAMAGCLAASFVNPYFYHLHRHILAYLVDPYQYKYIAEFQSISFHYFLANLFEVMVVLAAVAAFWNLLRREFVYVFLLVGWMHLALASGRNIPIFMLVAAPVVAATLTDLLRRLASAPVARWVRGAAERFDQSAAELDETDRIGRVHLVSVAALAGVALLLYAPAPPEKFQSDYDTKSYPAKAIQFLGGAGIPNRIFTHDEWGDYLIYKLYPTRVFVDGRSDFYGDKFCEQYQDVLHVNYNWEQILRQYGVDTVLLPPDQPLTGALKESRNWRLLYDDGMALVFRASTGQETRKEQVSAVRANSGTGRDRKITKSVNRGHTIT
jgi:hypothetical protein